MNCLYVFFMYLHYRCNTPTLSVGTCSRQSEARICNGSTVEHLTLYKNQLCVLQGYQLDYNITFIRILHQPPCTTYNVPRTEYGVRGTCTVLCTLIQLRASGNR